MKTLAEVVTPLIGKPYAKGAQGPGAFDCWSLVVHVERELFGRQLPRVSTHPDDVLDLMRFVADHPANALWQPAAGPLHGAMVQMSKATYPFHIGVYLDVDGGGVLHCLPKLGVTFDTALALGVSRWRCQYYDWKG